MSRLGGWWRLWTVLAALFCVVGGLLALQNRDLTATVDRKEARRPAYRGPAGCIKSTVRLQETYTGRGDPYSSFGTPVDPDPPEGFILDKDTPGVELKATCTTVGAVALGTFYGLLGGLAWIAWLGLA